MSALRENQSKVSSEQQKRIDQLTRLTSLLISLVQKGFSDCAVQKTNHKMCIGLYLNVVIIMNYCSFLIASLEVSV